MDTTEKDQPRTSDGEPNVKEAYEATEHEHKDAFEATTVTSAFADWGRGKCIRKFWRLYCTGLMVTWGGLYAGYANSVIGSIVANQGFINQFATVTDPETGKPALNANHISLWAAAYFITCIAIQFIAPYTADRFGRKFNMWAFTFFLTLSIVVAVVAKEWWVLLISRLIAGCAGGIIATSIMVYMSEMAMPQFRGALLSAFSMAFALGQLFLAVGLKILEDATPEKFRNLFYSEFLFAGVWLIPMIYLPESPAWCAAKGKHEQGKKALRRLVGPVEGYDVDREYAVMQQDVQQSVNLSEAKADSKSQWKACFAPINLKRIIIATLPFTFQNFVGVPLIFGYTTYFFQLANMEDPFLGNVIIQLILVVGIFSAFYFVDRVGRRALVIYGGASMGIICIIIGGLGLMEQTSSSGPALVALCSIWAFIYANSLAPIGWVSLVEISSPLLRAKTTAIAATIQYLSNILFNYTTPLMLSNQGANWGQKIGFFYGGVTMLYLIPCIFLFPEVKGRTYGELDELFERRVPAWKFAATKTAYQAAVESERADNP